MVLTILHHTRSHDLGPFELVKNAQILSVEMKAGKLRHFDKLTAASYAEKGVVQTFKTVIKNLGPQGLFVGFRYQIGSFFDPSLILLT